jgi:hypothetical protein
VRIIHVLRKPLSEGTVAANTLKHGTGGLNIDRSRITVSEEDDIHAKNPHTQSTFGMVGSAVYGTAKGGDPFYDPSQGRWPANVILQHLDGCRRDGVKRVKPSNGSGRAGAGSSGFQTSYVGGDSKGAGFTGGSVKDDGKETVANWVCESGCPVARLDEQSGVSKSGTAVNRNRAPAKGATDIYGTFSQMRGEDRGYGDTGGASRFFKQVGGSDE